MKNKLKPLLWIVLAIGIVVFLWYVRIIVGYVIISAILSLMGRPIIKLFDKIPIGKKHIPTGLSALLTLLVMGSVLFGIFSIFAPVVAEEARLISQVEMEQVNTALEKPIADCEAWLGQFDLGAGDQSHEEWMQESVAEVLNMTRVSKIFKSIIGRLGNIFVAIFSILFITFFFLKDRKLLPQIIFTLSPDEHHPKIKVVLRNVKALLQKYFLGLLAQITLITTLVSLGLYAVGVKNALVIGLFAGLINVVPYVGPLIGAFFGIIIALSSHLEMEFYAELLPLAGKIAGVFLTVQLLDNFVFQPLIFSKSVEVHPLEIFLVILIAGTLAGVGGMIIAIPFYSILRICANQFLSEFKVVRTMTKGMEQN